MNILGGLGASNFELYTRQYQSNLATEVATVSDTEAEWGAAQTDEVMLAAKQQPEAQSSVNLAHYATRAARLHRFDRRKSSSNSKDAPKSTHAADVARSQSFIGENAPLNWLVADHLGDSNSNLKEFSQHDGYLLAPTLHPERDNLLIGSSTTFVEPTLLNQDWLLSPCA